MRKITLSFLVVLFCAASAFAQKNVLYIQGNATPNVSDAYLIAALTTAGYTVTAIDDDVAVETDATAVGVNLVVISSTVSGSKVTKYAWIDKPIIVWEGATYLAYGLAGVNGGGFDNTVSLAINLASNTHPLQTGFSVGDNVIFTGTATAGTFSQYTFYAGSTTPAILLATLSSNPDVTKGAWAVFDKGTQLSPNTASTIVGYPADGLSVNVRIIVPFSNDFFVTANDLGLKLFMNSVEYALTGKVTAIKNVSSDANAKVWYSNGSINIEASKNLTNSNIKIYNFEGKLVKSSTISGSGRIALPMANLQNGMYMVVGEGFNGKFIKN